MKVKNLTAAQLKEQRKYCKDCGVELSFRESMIQVLMVDGDFYDVAGFCFICLDKWKFKHKLQRKYN